jgi:hypothetical protein
MAIVPTPDPATTIPTAVARLFANHRVTTRPDAVQTRENPPPTIKPCVKKRTSIDGAYEDPINPIADRIPPANTTTLSPNLSINKPEMTPNACRKQYSADKTPAASGASLKVNKSE